MSLNSRVSEPSTVGTIRTPKTAELVAVRLRSRIVHGELTAGDVLPTEAQLMEEFGVSRPTLREAVRILETESLIGSRRGTRGGATIMTPDIGVAARYVGLILQLQGTTVADVYEARTVSEPYCARLLAENHTDDDMADLRTLVANLRELTTGDLGNSAAMYRWSALTTAFHQLITQRAGNNTLAAQSGVLQDIVRTHHEQTLAKGARMKDPAKYLNRACRSFEKLVGLIDACDGPGAQNHWTAHMQVAGRGLFRESAGDKTIVDLFD